jgi:hypothetical protein
LFIGKNGTLHIVKCRVCAKVERKNKIFGVKWDSLCKHVGRRKVMKNMGFDVKKETSFTPRFVNMPRTNYKKHLHLVTRRLLMPN